MKINKSQATNYILEVLVIIIGITISLSLDQWRENQRNRQSEIHSLENICGNLMRDTTVIKSRIQFIKLFEYGHKQLLQNSQNLSGDSLAVYIDFVNSYTVLTGTNIAYEELKQTGSSKFIKNRKLLNDIITHYELRWNTVQEWNEVDKNFVLTQVLPYSMETIQYAPDDKLLFNDSTSIIRLVNEDNQLKNLIKSGQIFKATILYIYQMILQETTILIEKINEELEQLKG